MVDGHTDYNLPCASASAVPCAADFNFMHVDVGEFEADTVVLGKTSEVSGVAGKEPLFPVDPLSRS